MTHAELIDVIQGQDRNTRWKLHREYYAQFVTPYIRHIVQTTIGLDTLLASQDPFLNNIPLVNWDSMHVRGTRSLAESVCLNKEAARQIIEAHRGDLNINNMENLNDG